MKLSLSFAPHVRSDITTRRLMLDVIIALTPQLVMAAVIFGARALLVTAVCAASCVFFEWGFEKWLKRPNTIGDLSAVITGILLAFNLPVTIPLWQAVVGSFAAIILAKQLFGGLGKNFANPAIVGRIVMFLAFSKTMTTWVQLPDAVTSATPLAILKWGDSADLPAMWNMIIGTRGGCLGETSAVALLAGGVYLMVRKVITWHTPVTYIATVTLLSALLGGPPLYHLFAGGLLLGAIFMATDYSTSPQTLLGRTVFGVCAGLLTVLIRFYGSYPEGVSFAILIMNTLVPIIDRFTASKPLGGVKQ